MRSRKQRISFFEELEFLESGFMKDLEEMIAADELSLAIEEAYKEFRQAQAQKGHRLYPRLRRVERFHCWNRTSHIPADEHGRVRERKKAAKLLYEKRERLRLYLRALYEYFMFDIPIPWLPSSVDLRYSRHRKILIKLIREHKRNARKIKHTSRKALREQKRREATAALDALKASKHIQRLRDSPDEEFPT